MTSSQRWWETATARIAPSGVWVGVFTVRNFDLIALDMLSASVLPKVTFDVALDAAAMGDPKRNPPCGTTPGGLYWGTAKPSRGELRVTLQGPPGTPFGWLVGGRGGASGLLGFGGRSLSDQKKLENPQ